MPLNTRNSGVFSVKRHGLRAAVLTLTLGGCLATAEEQVLREKQQIEKSTYSVEDRQIESVLRKQDFFAALEGIHSAQRGALADIPRQQYLSAKERSVKHEYAEYLLDRAIAPYQGGDLPTALKFLREALAQEPDEPRSRTKSAHLEAELAHCQKLYSRAEVHLHAKRWRQAKDVLDAPELTRFAASFAHLHELRRTANVALAEEAIGASQRALNQHDMARVKKLVSKCKLDWAYHPEALARCGSLDDMISSREEQAEAKKALKRGDSKTALALANLADGQFSDGGTKDTVNQAKLALAQSLAKEAGQAANRGRRVEACNQYDKAAKLVGVDSRYAQYLYAQADEQRSELAKKLYQLYEQKKREHLPGATWLLLTMAKDLAKVGPTSEKIRKEPLPELKEALHQDGYQVSVSVNIGGVPQPEFTQVLIDELSRECGRRQKHTVFFIASDPGLPHQATLKLELVKPHSTDEGAEISKSDTRSITYTKPSRVSNPRWVELKNENEELQSKQSTTKQDMDAFTRLSNHLAPSIADDNHEQLARLQDQARRRQNAQLELASQYFKDAKQHRQSAAASENEAEKNELMRSAAEAEKQAEKAKADADEHAIEEQKLSEKIKFAVSRKEKFDDNNRHLRELSASQSQLESRLMVNKRLWDIEKPVIDQLEPDTPCKYTIERRTQSVTFPEGKVVLTDLDTNQSIKLPIKLAPETFDFYPGNVEAPLCPKGPGWTAEVRGPREDLPTARLGNAELTRRLLKKQMSTVSQALIENLLQHGSFLVAAASSEKPRWERINLWALVLHANGILSEPDKSQASAKQALLELGWDEDEHRVILSSRLEELLAGVR